MRYILKLLIVIVIMVLHSACGSGPKVEFVQSEDKIDVFIGGIVGGKYFTSYIYNSDLVKPILWPLFTKKGIEMTRAFPFRRVEGESTDHPHHTGIFFTYDINNRDKFWNSAEPPPQIKHTEFKEVTDGKEGTLAVSMDWISVTGKTLLQENRTMVFSAIDNGAAVDLTIDLTAKDTVVVFEPTKEGMLGIRVADWLKEKDNTGEYMNSDGEKNEKNVWGKRSEWVTLQGNKGEQKVGIAIMNHPTSENAPTFWHARAYGLFSANPLGQMIFQKSRKVEVEEYELKLEPGESAQFKFKVVVYDGHKTKEQLEAIYNEYAK